MCWTYIYHYAEVRGISAEVAGSYQLAAFIVFFISRFIFTYLMKFISAAKLLYLLAVTAIVLVLIVILNTTLIGLYALVGISFTLSLMFPTIYGLALEGMPEEEAKIGAAGLVMAIVGGALMPTIQGNILDLGGPGLQDVQVLGYTEINYSFTLPLISFIIIALYARSVLSKTSLTDSIN